MSSFEAAVLLAGGRSARMGKEKALLDAGGETLVERQVRRLGERFDRVGVSLAHGRPSPGLDEALARASAALGAGRLVRFHDPVAGEGPLRALAECLASCVAELESRRLLCVAVDAPEIDFDLVRALMKASLEKGAAGAVPVWSHGLEPAFAVYGCELTTAASSLLGSGERSLKALASWPGVRQLDLSSPAERRRIFGGREVDLSVLFAPLNTPEQYAAWRKRR